MSIRCPVFLIHKWESRVALCLDIFAETAAALHRAMVCDQLSKSRDCFLNFRLPLLL